MPILQDKQTDVVTSDLDHDLLHHLDYAHAAHTGFEPAQTKGDISTSTNGVTIANGTNSTVGPDVTVNIATASAGSTGLLTGTDWNTFNSKASALGYTPENQANKDTDPNLTSNSNIKYPSQAAVKSYVDTSLNTKQNALGFTPENVGNKSANTSLGASDTLYPTQNAVKTYADTKLTGNAPISAGTFTKLTVDTKGLVTNGTSATTNDIPTVTNKRYVSDADLVTLSNTSGTNTGDETDVSIKAKLGVATNVHSGYLTSTDWTTFNSKQSAITPGDLTAGSSKVTVIGGSAELFGVGASVDVNEANLTLSNMGGTLGLTHGGTGQTTANSALNAILPDQTGNNNKVLKTDGANTSWVANSASVSWGAITGTLSDQTDLNSALTAKQDALGFTPENIANKDTSTTLGISDTKYPSQAAVKSYVDTGLSGKQNSLGFTPVAANGAITGGTNLKITYDTKGLVTSGTTAATTDLSDTAISSPALNQVLSYNGTKWVNSNPNNVSGGPGVDFYLDDTTIIATGTNNAIQVNSLLKSPNTAIVEQTDSVAVTAGTSPVLDEAYLYNTALGGTSLDAGIWELDTYCFVNSTAGGRVSSINVPTFVVKLGGGTIATTGSGTTRTVTVTGGSTFVSADFNAARNLTGYVQTPQGLYPITSWTSFTVVTIATPSTYANETGVAYSLWRNFFRQDTGTITTTSVSRVTTQTAQPAGVISPTDKLGVIYFGVSNNTTTVSFTHNGTAHYSHFTAPLTIRHNDLAGLQGGTSNDYQHLTSAQLTVVSNTSNINSGDQTFIAPRTASTTSSTTPTPNAGTTDEYILTALAEGATFGVPSGSPVEGQKLLIRIKDNGSAQTLAWNAIYRASSDLALPSTTVISKTLYLGFVFNNTDTKWDLIALLNNI